MLYEKATAELVGMYSAYRLDEWPAINSQGPQATTGLAKVFGSRPLDAVELLTREWYA